jgi:hypothetical protein
VLAAGEIGRRQNAAPRLGFPLRFFDHFFHYFLSNILPKIRKLALSNYRYETFSSKVDVRKAIGTLGWTEPA